MYCGTVQNYYQNDLLPLETARVTQRVVQYNIMNAMYAEVAMNSAVLVLCVRARPNNIINTSEKMSLPPPRL